MKKSQFITVIIMFLVASVLIAVGAFGKDTVKPGETAPTDVLVGGTVAPLQTKAPSETDAPTQSAGNESESPSQSGAVSETPSSVVTVPPSDKPSDDPEKPVEFTEIKNADFATISNDFTYWTSYWKDSGNGQNVPVFDENIKKNIGDVEYIFLNDSSASEWQVYITFATHYDYGETGKILDSLKSSNVKATFFVTAKYIQDNPEIVKRIKSEGHLIGTRGPIGEDIAYMTAEEFAEAMLAVEKEYQKLFGENERMDFYRPDFFSARTLKVADALGYKIVFRTYTSVSDEAEWDDNDVDSATISLRLWERGAYEGSVPEFTVSKNISDALSSYLKECVENNIKFKRLDE